MYILLEWLNLNTELIIFKYKGIELINFINGIKYIIK